jgi:hypothetical protein
LNPETLVFEVEPQEGQGRFMFCNSDWSIYFALDLLLGNTSGGIRGELLKLVQIVPKPRGLGVDEWLEFLMIIEPCERTIHSYLESQ